jgi:transcriptional regulator with GAF, ATPase, and Fis domain
MAVDDHALMRSIDALTESLSGLAGSPGRSAAAHLAAIVAAAADLLKVDSAGILLLDDVGRLRAAASATAMADRLEQAQQRLGIGPGHDTISRRSTVLVDNLSDEPAYAPLVAELAPLRIGAVLSTPIWVEHQVVGNLNLIRTDAHSWSEQEARAAAAYAEVVGKLLGISARRGSYRPAAPDGRPGAIGGGGGHHAG